jgi:hypothetical protein
MEITMALSDACFDFHMDVSAAASRLAEQAHHYSAPHNVIKYGPEIDALRRSAEYFAENPYDPEAGARLLRLCSTVLTYLDTPPSAPELAQREKVVRELVRIIGSELSPEDIKALPSIVDNIVSDTHHSEKAARRLKAMLSKVGKSTYDTAVKVIGDVAVAAVKKYLGI